MSGPTMGRLLKSEIGTRFVSANLPMLHKRTLEGTGQSEFRPGVRQEAAVVDLSGEFERQFYGDVTLFSVERLTAAGFPQQVLSEDVIAGTFEAVRVEMLARYNARQRLILGKLTQLEALLHDPSSWWNGSADHAAAVGHFGAFADNVASNFGEGATGCRRINAAANWSEWRSRLVEAVARYPEDRKAWEDALDTTRAAP
jgi:hypothetical protein